MTDNAPDRSLLCELAEALGVATEYWGYDGNLKAVADDTLIKVFAALGGSCWKHRPCPARPCGDPFAALAGGRSRLLRRPSWR